MPLISAVMAALIGLEKTENAAAAASLATSSSSYNTSLSLIIRFIVSSLSLSIWLSLWICPLIAVPFPMTIVLLFGLADGMLHLLLVVVP